MLECMKKFQESTFFYRAPETDFRHETEARKVMVDFKFNALYRYLSQHREPLEVGVEEMLSGSLYWCMELGVPTLYRECYHTL